MPPVRGGGDSPPGNIQRTSLFGKGSKSACISWLKSYAAAKEILICIALSEVNLLNSTKDDILDMEELFHMLTNFREQSLMPC